MTQISIPRLLLPVATVCALTACGNSDSPNPLANWTGKTFLLDTPSISGSKWKDPPGAGSALAEFVPQLLIGVEAGSGGTPTVTLSTALGGQQDDCNPTTEATVSDVNYPEILISAKSFPIRVQDSDPERSDNVVSGTAYGFSLKNALPGTTATTPTSELIATLDVSQLYPLAYRITSPTADKVCATFKDNGVDCQACPEDSSKVYCIKVRAVQVAATSTDKPLKKISSDEIPASCS